MKLSKIGWCDYSGKNLNFAVRGSTPGDCERGPGCTNCYVKALDDRFHFLPEHTTFYPEKLKKLAGMKFPEFSPKRGAPYRPMCFVCDTGDIFHEDVPDMIVMKALDIMHSRTDVTWQILTKRPERMRWIVRAWQMTKCFTTGEPVEMGHLWLGVSVSNQRTADERIPILLDTPAAVRWVSAEPLLERINLLPYLPVVPIKLWSSMTEGEAQAWLRERNWLDWIVTGAESGPNRRHFDKEWAADILHQCQGADVAYFGKQDSGLYPGKPLIVDGREWKEWPK